MPMFVFFRAELCRNVHPNPEFVASANDAYTTVSTLTVGYNADRSLYEPLAQLYASGISLTDEQHAMLTSLKLDFERGGIGLPEEERNLVADLQNRAHALGAEFSSIIASTTAFVDIEAEASRRFPPALKAQLRRSRSGAPGTVSLPVADSVVAPQVMKYVEDSHVRKRIYEAENSRCGARNLPVLDNLLHARHKFAELLGFKSYGDLSFSGRLASSPEEVVSFLDALSAELNGAAMREDKLLVQAKLQGNPSDSVDCSALQVSAWDRAHLMGKAKERAFELNSGVVSEYLPLDACLQGMATVMEDIFGVRMVPVPRAECKNELWHKDVVKMELRHESDGVQGHVYLDLYPRPGKYGHAAHFCLRGGRECASGAYQTPVVALVCNFAPAGDGMPVLLSFGEYETLWHEWGHAIHSLLSRTRYQHLSGTRVATDLVEVPSHLFEHFAWDPRVLSRISSHYRTQEPMPTRLIQALCASRHQFVASDLQFQTLYASLDLVFHGASPPVGRTSDVAAVLQSRLTNVRHVDGTAPHAAFQHFVGYGAGYYSCALQRICAPLAFPSTLIDLCTR